MKYVYTKSCTVIFFYKRINISLLIANHGLWVAGVLMIEEFTGNGIIKKEVLDLERGLGDGKERILIL